MVVEPIIINHLFGLRIGKLPDKIKNRKTLLIVGVSINLLALVYFKYSNFIVDNINIILGSLNLGTIAINKVRLPIGISFYTFQSLSYLVDVYRKETKATKNPVDLGLYIALFPQLIAGPIVRYHDINEQIRQRKITFELFYSGTKKFIAGLGKKVIIANTVGYYADTFFNFPSDELSSGLLVWGAILYSFQIYFDFSGYSDMAIGLGRMFGFNILENFNFPYISTSIKEFWRRWHISLSNWFRDYLYIPLGGNRKGVKMTYINLGIVFLVTGLWHGASWNFVIWGIWHGMFLIIERIGLDKILARIPKIFSHIYMLSVVLIGWILFRVEDMHHFIDYFSRLLSFNSNTTYTVADFTNREIITATALGVIFSMPWIKVRNFIEKYSIVEIIVYFIIFTLSVLSLSASTYNPFIYFQF